MNHFYLFIYFFNFPLLPVSQLILVVVAHFWCIDIWTPAHGQTALSCECVCRCVSQCCVLLEVTVLTETVDCESGLYVLIVLAKSDVVRMFGGRMANNMRESSVKMRNKVREDVF